MEKPRIIFMGTPEFAVPSIEAIHSKYGVSAVVTVPDKPQGRGLKLTPPPVKRKAGELGIPVFQPENLKDEEFISQIREIEPDIIVVIAFRILPRELYSIPRIASFNIHGSLLPKYRGAAPINWAIINGETKSGLTSFILQDKVDTGDILLTRECGITPGMTAGELHDALMEIAAGLSVETIDLLAGGGYKTYSQDNSQATPAPKLNKENTRIVWDREPAAIANFIHGLSPYPGAWTEFGSGQMKILKVKALDKTISDKTPGTFIIKDGKFLAAAQNGFIEILELQPPNKKAMPVADFINGYRGDSEGMMS